MHLSLATLSFKTPQRISAYRASSPIERGRGEIVEALAAVKPFCPFSLRKQAISRVASWLHPPFATLISPTLARVVNGLNWMHYGRYTILGTEHLPDPKQGPYIFASNHCSTLDPSILGPVITQYFGRQPWIMAKQDLWEHGASSVFFDLLGGVPFQRHAESQAEYLNNLESSAALLHAKESELIFVEGTRPGGISQEPGVISKPRSAVRKETGLLPAGPLLAHLCCATGAKVIPLGISGSGKARPPEVDAKLVPKRPKKDQQIQVRFGPVIDLSPHFTELLDNKRAVRIVNSFIMPAISRLVDFRLHEIPLEHPPTEVPMSEADFERIQAYETVIRRLLAEKPRC